MFSAGTRVYACSSAITGKKLGPKRHSLGYVSNSGTTYHVKYVRDFPIKNQTFMFTPLTIVFTRYGKEEKQRCETRDFLQILPVFENGREQQTISETVKQIISIFNGGELSKNTHWRSLCNNYVNDPTNIGTVLPVGCTKPGTMSKNDSNAWVSSIIRNKHFRQLIKIKKNRELPAFKNLVADSELPIWLANAMRLNKTRHDLISWSKADPKNMIRLIGVLRRLNIVFNKRMFDNNMKDGTTMLDNGSVRIDPFLTWLSNELLSDERIIIRKGGIIKGSRKCLGTHNNLARNLRVTRSTYLNLKPKYV
jgi:hypothetical protein